MKLTAKKHGIYKNLSGETIFNSQAATLIFLTGIAFKLSAAPGMINEEFGSSTFWAFVAYSAIDVVLTTLVFLFARSSGDALLVATNSVLYRAFSFVAMVFMSLKGVFHFAYAASYLTHELFEGLEPSLIYLLFLLPVVYLGIKGIRTIARTGEVFFFVIVVALAVNLAFLNTKMDFARVLPVFSKEPSTLVATFPRYGLWLGDMLPFAFVKIKDKRLPYITASIVGTWLTVCVVVLLGVAIYGDALKTVTDLLIRIAGFNQLSKDIGRTEWSNLLVMIISAIVSMSFTYFGATAACKRALKTDVPIKIAYPLAILLAIFIIPSAQTVTDFATNEFSYVMFLLALSLPILFVLVFLAKRQRYQHIQKLLDEEYISQKDSLQTVDSKNMAVLDGFKLSQSNSQHV